MLALTLETVFTDLERTQDRTLRTVDVVPADPQDANGLTSFYLVVGWCVGGYLCASIMTISSCWFPTADRSSGLASTTSASSAGARRA